MGSGCMFQTFKASMSFQFHCQIFTVNFQIDIQIDPMCLSPRDQSGTEVAQWLSSSFLKEILGSYSNIHNLELSKGVDKQFYGVTFPSSSLSIISLVPSMSLWFSSQSCFQEVWALVISLSRVLFMTVSASRSE